MVFNTYTSASKEDAETRRVASSNTLFVFAFIHYGECGFFTMVSSSCLGFLIEEFVCGREQPSELYAHGRIPHERLDFKRAIFSRFCTCRNASSGRAMLTGLEVAANIGCPHCLLFHTAMAEYVERQNKRWLKSFIWQVSRRDGAQ
jgi:hypothetical protein